MRVAKMIRTHLKSCREADSRDLDQRGFQALEMVFVLESGLGLAGHQTYHTLHRWSFLRPSPPARGKLDRPYSSQTDGMVACDVLPPVGATFSLAFDHDEAFSYEGTGFLDQAFLVLARDRKHPAWIRLNLVFAECVPSPRPGDTPKGRVDDGDDDACRGNRL